MRHDGSNHLDIFDVGVRVCARTCACHDSLNLNVIVAHLASISNKSWIY